MLSTTSDNDVEQYIIAERYYHQKDYANALIWYERSALQNNRDAMNQLASIYYHGNGVPVDYKLAMTWYLKSGDHVSKTKIGEMYLYGRGVDVDYGQAMIWFQKGGSDEAYSNMGWMYYKGYGVPVDYAMAMKWYQYALKSGNREVHSRIGLLYRDGLGVEKDMLKALEYLKRGAEAMHAEPDMMYELAWFYETEEGFKDLQLAVDWYNQAAYRGSKKAKEALTRLKAQDDSINIYYNENQDEDYTF